MYDLKTKLSALMLSCPKCHGSIDCNSVNYLLCASCETSYPIAQNRPVLIRPDNEIFCVADFVNSLPKPYQRSRWSAYLPAITADLAATRVIGLLAKKLDLLGPSKILVVGGGCQRDWLDSLLCKQVLHNVVYTDIDTAADVDIFCDAHDLPFRSGSFDAVITTAVLEHVMYPERVAAEIARALRIGGLLYSEVPFMQQVHEGAYDFTRYTLSGHRRLLNKFEEIEAGITAGPASALAWSLENFAIAFFNSTKLRMIVAGMCRILFGSLKYIDNYLVKKNSAVDGACGTFFYGLRSEQTRSDIEIIRSYKGAKHFEHS